MNTLKVSVSETSAETLVTAQICENHIDDRLLLLKDLEEFEQNQGNAVEIVIGVKSFETAVKVQLMLKI